MQTQEQTILLVSDDAALCAAARKELEARGSSRRVAAVSNAAAARDILVHAAPMAIDLIEERLRLAAEEPMGTSALLRDENNQEAFGETLRHELNNPLTGILGNAELLLAEVRRKNDGQLPNGGQQRLETIAALAVRLRETVRRLSQEWENRHRRMPHRAVQQRVAH